MSVGAVSSSAPTGCRLMILSGLVSSVMVAR